MKAEDQVLELGDRKFTVLTERSVGNDHWIMAESGRVGLTSLHMEAAETAFEFATRVMKTAIDGGAVFRILGGLLVPEGKTAADWTPKMAEETGDFLQRLAAKPDKEIINGATAGLLKSFFERGLVSATTSATFSQAMETLRRAQEGGGPAHHNGSSDQSAAR